MAARVDAVFLAGAEIELRENLVGGHAGGVGARGEQRVAAQRRGEAVGGKIGDDFLGEFDGFQLLEAAEEVADEVGVGGEVERLDDAPGVVGLAAQGEMVVALDFNDVHAGGGQRIEQVMLGEIPVGRAEGIEPRARDGDDVRVAEAAGEDERGIVGRAFAELHGDQAVGTGGEAQLGLGCEQAEGIGINLRIVADEGLHGPALEVFEELLEARVVGALGGLGQGEAPELIGGVALQFELARTDADVDAVEVHAGQVEERGAAPVGARARELVEQRGFDDVDGVGVAEAQVEFVADGGAGAEAQLGAVVAELQADDGARGIQSVIGEAAGLGLPRRLGDERAPAQLGGGAREGFDGRGEGGVVERRGEEPGFVGAQRAEGELVLRDLDRSDERGFQVGKEAREFRRGGRGFLGAALEEEDEQEQRDGGEHQPFGRLGVHAWFGVR